MSRGLLFLFGALLVMATSLRATLDQGSERMPNAGNGISVGIVVDERQERVARAQVHAFSVRAAAPQSQQQQSVPAASSAALVAQFKSERVFWRQFTIAKEIVDRHDSSVLASLVGWLSPNARQRFRVTGLFPFDDVGVLQGAPTTIADV